MSIIGSKGGPLLVIIALVIPVILALLAGQLNFAPNLMLSRSFIWRRCELILFVNLISSTDEPDML